MIETGVFLSDMHMPDNIPLKPVFDYIRDVKPKTVILGGDIIDATGLHASESMRAEEIKMSWFKRDCALLKGLVADIRKIAKQAKIVFLEGNHEERYARLQAKFPDLFETSLDMRGYVKGLVDKFIPYGKADSYHVISDCVFTHGNIFPDAHAKAYALRYTPMKVVYGHLHHFQAYTTHRALVFERPRYSLTAGCLSTTNPDWKRGASNQWVNGFVTFWTDGKVTVPSPVLIEQGKFVIGGKVYG
jgi:predicted phosphodiesterase